MEANLAAIEGQFPGALKAYQRDVALLERTEFHVDDGFLYAETVNGCTYTWSSEDLEWFDS